MDPTWVIPAAGQVIRNREEIVGTWRRVLNLLMGKKSQLAITGMPGTGKSVLLDHLSGEALRSDYSPPERSAQVERETLHKKGQRLALAAIPGQKASNRMRAVDELFLGKIPVRGVLHVVSFGYTETRSSFAIEAMEDTRLTDLRKARLEEELADLQETCSAVRAAWTRRREPIWLLVAVNKVDLYSDDDALAEARHRYSPAAASDFSRILQELQSQVGSDNFSWEAIPTCSWLEDFVWGDERIQSRLDVGQRNDLLKRLGTRISARCEGKKDA